jgi:hypothetical protein
MAGEQPSQGFGVDSSSPERGVEAAPSATMRPLEAQVSRGRDGAALAVRMASVSSKRASDLGWRQS